MQEHTVMWYIGLDARHQIRGLSVQIIQVSTTLFWVETQNKYDANCLICECTDLLKVTCNILQAQI